MALRFTYIKTSEPHNFEGKIRLRRMLLSIFFKLTEYGIRSAGGRQVFARLWRVGRFTPWRDSMFDRPAMPLNRCESNLTI
jgi:hypothetical protein